MIEIDRIRAEAIAPDELSLATSYLDGVFPIRFETTAAIAAALSVLVDARAARRLLRSVSRARARDDDRADPAGGAATTCIPTRCRWSSVGDPAAIRGPLEQLGFGAIDAVRHARRTDRMTCRTTATESADAGRRPGKISSRRIYTGRIIAVDTDTVRFPDGSIGELDMVRHPGASAVVPFSQRPRGDDPQMLLLKQYRYAAEQYLYEIPAGRLEPGEDPRDCAIRELREETGCTRGAGRVPRHDLHDAGIHRRADSSVHGNRARAWRDRP